MLATVVTELSPRLSIAEHNYFYGLKALDAQSMRAMARVGMEKRRAHTCINELIELSFPISNEQQLHSVKQLLAGQTIVLQDTYAKIVELEAQLQAESKNRASTRGLA